MCELFAVLLMMMVSAKDAFDTSFIGYGLMGIQLAIVVLGKRNVPITVTHFSGWLIFLGFSNLFFVNFLFPGVITFIECVAKTRVELKFSLRRNKFNHLWKKYKESKDPSTRPELAEVLAILPACSLRPTVFFIIKMRRWRRRVRDRLGLAKPLEVVVEPTLTPPDTTEVELLPENAEPANLPATLMIDESLYAAGVFTRPIDLPGTVEDLSGLEDQTSPSRNIRSSSSKYRTPNIPGRSVLASASVFQRPKTVSLSPAAKNPQTEQSSE